MAADGVSNRDIAEALFVTIKTVETLGPSFLRDGAVSPMGPSTGAVSRLQRRREFWTNCSCQADCLRSPERVP